MKHSYLPLVLFTTFSLLLGAATTQAQVTLDFSTKKITQTGSFRRGDDYQVVIDNINPLLYKISIAARDTSTAVGLTPPTFGSLGLTELSTLASAIGSLGGVVAAPGGAANSLFKAGPGPGYAAPDLADPAEYVRRFDEADYPATFARLVRKDFGPSPTARQTEIIAALLVLSYQMKLQDYQAQLVDQKNTVEKLLAAANTYTTEALYADGPGTGLTKTKLQQLNTDITTVRNAMIATEQRALRAFQNYTLLSSRYAALFATKLKSDDEKLKLIQQELAKTFEAAKATVSAENVRKINEALVVILNNASRTYTSLPIQFTKDQSQLKISIVPRDEKSMLQAYSTTLLFPLNTTNFWGVSSGLYASGLHNEAFSVRTLLDSEQDTIPQYGLVQEKPGKAEFGVSAMVRYGWHKPTWPVGFQLGFGPGVVITDKIRPRMMAGIGPVFGQNHKLLVDVGLVAGYVDRRSTAYAQDGPYFAKPEQVTVPQLKVNGYFALHYLFLKY